MRACLSFHGFAFAVALIRKSAKEKLPMNSHKRQLIAEWYERDYPNHLKTAGESRDLIIQRNLSWEQARNVKELMQAPQVGEDVS